MKVSKAKITDRLANYLLQSNCDRLIKNYEKASADNGEVIDFYTYTVGECEHRAHGIYRDILRSFINRFEESDFDDFSEFVEFLRHESESRINIKDEEV